MIELVGLTDEYADEYSNYTSINGQLTYCNYIFPLNGTRILDRKDGGYFDQNPWDWWGVKTYKRRAHAETKTYRSCEHYAARGKIYSFGDPDKIRDKTAYNSLTGDNHYYHIPITDGGSRMIPMNYCKKEYGPGYRYAQPAIMAVRAVHDEVLGYSGILMMAYTDAPVMINPDGYVSNAYSTYSDTYRWRCVVNFDRGNKKCYFASNSKSIATSECLLPGVDYTPQRYISVLRDHMIHVISKLWYDGTIKKALKYTDISKKTSKNYLVSLDDFTVPPVDSIFPKEHRNGNWNAIAFECYQNLGTFDGNGIAYVNDVGEIGSSFLSFAETLKKMPKSKVKSAAQAYLSVHYGFKLFAMDTHELKNSLSKSSINDDIYHIRRSRSWTKDGKRYRNCIEVVYDKYANFKSQLHALLDDMDMLPTLENTWDMIPYSFVIDWFVNVGDKLTAMDNYTKLATSYKTICSIRTVICEADITSELAKRMGIVGRQNACDLELRYYVRKVEPDTLIVPSSDNSTTPQLFDHSIEGAALIASRR